MDLKLRIFLRNNSLALPKFQMTTLAKMNFPFSKDAYSKSKLLELSQTRLILLKCQANQVPAALK